jgi:hypothetical protein
MYWLTRPTFPVNVCGEAGAAGAAAGAVCADTVSGIENAADTAEASNSLRMVIPFQRLKKVWRQNQKHFVCQVFYLCCFNSLYKTGLCPAYVAHHLGAPVLQFAQLRCDQPNRLLAR